MQARASTPARPDTTHAAIGDCERVRHRVVGQPVNTATSAAYLASAAWVHRTSAGRPGAWPAVLVWLGLGSIAYHGPGTRAGKAIHDSAMVAAVLTAAADVAARRVPPARRVLVAASVGGAAAVVHARSRTGAPACRSDSIWQGHGLWHLLSALALTSWASATGTR